MALSPGILHGIEIKVSLHRPGLPPEDITNQKRSWPSNPRMRALDPSEVVVTEVEETAPLALLPKP
jgi:hypothetical protein